MGAPRLYERTSHGNVYASHLRKPMTPKRVLAVTTVIFIALFAGLLQANHLRADPLGVFGVFRGLNRHFRIISESQWPDPFRGAALRPDRRRTVSSKAP